MTSLSNQSPESVVRAAGIVIFVDDENPIAGNEAETARQPKQFLLMRHADRWDLPKGHCDGEETFRETALREMQEETGIPPEQIAVDPVFQFDLKYQVSYRRRGDRVFQKHVRYFLGQAATRPDVQLTEHESHQWFDWIPPHHIQQETIDPLLAAVAKHWQSEPRT